MTRVLIRAAAVALVVAQLVGLVLVVLTVGIGCAALLHQGGVRV